MELKVISLSPFKAENLSFYYITVHNDDDNDDDDHIGYSLVWEDQKGL
jgi:hypothetical protein